MSQSITIKTVTAPPFKEAWNMLTPRLHLVVGFTKGGTSYLTGRDIPRGYDISIQHDRLSEGGTVSMLLDARSGNPTASLEPAARFSAKTLERIAADVRSGKHDATIAELYAQAKANRSEFAWPEFLLCQYCGCDCTDEHGCDAYTSDGESALPVDGALATP